MSLTHVIKHNANFRQAVKNSTVRPSVTLNIENMVEPKTKQHMLVGTAFDYLVGFTIQSLNGGMIKGRCDLVADRSFEIMKYEAVTLGISEQTIRDTSDRLLKFKQHSKAYIETGILTRDFAASIVEAAQLDQIYRSGRYPRLPLPRASKGHIDDLLAMHRIMPMDLLSASSSAYIGPDFGHASQMVGGADADFVIDRVLLDTKTTIKPSIPLSMWCQVVGYYLLNHVQKQVGAPFIEIDRLGIYFARLGRICDISVKDSIPNPEHLALLLLGHNL